MLIFACRLAPPMELQIGQIWYYSTPSPFLFIPICPGARGADKHKCIRLYLIHGYGYLEMVHLLSILTHFSYVFFYGSGSTKMMRLPLNNTELMFQLYHFGLFFIQKSKTVKQW
jgi:hypothetical protein